MTTRLIPNEDTPHDRLCLTILVPNTLVQQRVSTKRTERYAKKVGDAVLRSLYATYYGPSAQKYLPSVGHYACSAKEGLYLIRVHFELPPDSCRKFAQQTINRAVDECGSGDLEGYLQIERFYTVHEVEQLNW